MNGQFWPWYHRSTICPDPHLREPDARNCQKPAPCDPYLLREELKRGRGSPSGLWFRVKRGILRDPFDRVLGPSDHPQSEE
jgi:hypothetical protein